MTAYVHTNLWRTTLARHEDEHEALRDQLRTAYESFRERAVLLAGEIARSLPDFTVHDITHIDALWEAADRIGGPDLYLTPVESFVLGGAFLVHDLGLGLAAYPGGEADLAREPLWRGEVARLLRKEMGRTPSPTQITEAPERVRRLATAVALRELHAAQAERIVTQRWANPRTGEHWYLIESPELRHALGGTIARIAHSHWWDVSRLQPEFGERLGAPPRFPQEWTVDPLLLAALLRVADVSQLDSYRAPGFLFALRRPAEDAVPHWVFQQHLHKPIVEEDNLVYTSGRSFPERDADAWWLCLGHLRSVDRELRDADRLLQATQRPRLRVRGVRGVEEPARFATLVRTEGWLPVDVRVRVGDAVSLVRRLGGEQLYGNDPSVALRELIQNASDAVRARRLMEEREPAWGAIRVTAGTDDTGDWLEVEDTGIGMSEAVLTGPLLDFGNSYWDSALMTRELPTLLARGFEATGRFGIGFFSVFMAGRRVRVASRRYDAAQAETRVLEFREGVEGRPILRAPRSADEQVRDGGTRVRVWLNLPLSDLVAPLRLFWERFRPRLFDADLLSGREPPPLAPEEEMLERFCAWLCPALDVDLWIRRTVDGNPVRVVGASDWLQLMPRDLVLRTYGLREPWSEAMGADLRFADERMRLLVDQENPVGRACLPPLKGASLSQGGGLCALTAGGIRLTTLPGAEGIMAADPRTAVRNDAVLAGGSEVLARWATEQGRIGPGTFADETAAATYAAQVAAFGGDPGRLPFVQFRGAWVSAEEIRQWTEPAGKYLVVEASLFDGVNIEGVPVKLPNRYGNVFVLNATFLNYVPVSNPDDPWAGARTNRGTFDVLTAALAEAWGVSEGEVLDASDMEMRLRVIGTRGSARVRAWARVLRRPDSQKDNS